MADFEDDRAFLAAFEAAAIPSERWAHRDHVRMAFLYLRERPFDEALERIRVGIRALNRANGVEESATGGYHETATVAWTRLIGAALRHHGPDASFAAFAAANPFLLEKTLLRAFYSRARILSAEARARFVEPDLGALPSPPSRG